MRLLTFEKWKSLKTEYDFFLNRTSYDLNFEKKNVIPVEALCLFPNASTGITFFFKNVIRVFQVLQQSMMVPTNIFYIEY